MIRLIRRYVDIPPLWLGVFSALAWAQGTYLPVIRLGHWADWLGGALGLAGIGIGLIAVAQFFLRHTSIIPRDTPSALVQHGLYRLSRNPIYLGDVLFLAGVIFYFDAILSAVLIPAFMRFIEWRYIEGEEARIGAQFGEVYDAYKARVRRWL